MKSWIYRWGPAIVIMAIIFIASATPGSDIPGFGDWDEFFKKGGHMLGYALLATAFYHALNSSKRSIKLKFILVLCLVALYAASDEFHQRFTPGRSRFIPGCGHRRSWRPYGHCRTTLCAKAHLRAGHELNRSTGCANLYLVILSPGPKGSRIRCPLRDSITRYRFKRDGAEGKKPAKA